MSWNAVQIVRLRLCERAFNNGRCGLHLGLLADDDSFFFSIRSLWGFSFAVLQAITETPPDIPSTHGNSNVTVLPVSSHRRVASCYFVCVDASRGRHTRAETNQRRQAFLVMHFDRFPTVYNGTTGFWIPPTPNKVTLTPAVCFWAPAFNQTPLVSLPRVPALTLTCPTRSRGISFHHCIVEITPNS